MKFIRRLLYYGQSVVRMILNFKEFPSLVPLFLNRKRVEERILRLRKPPLQFIIRGAMDIWSVKETILDAFYTRYGVPLEDGWTIIDIGAGIGDFSIYAAYDHPNSKILAYEPFPESFRFLEKNIALNGIPNIHAFKLAVWSYSGTLHLDSSGGEPLQVVSRKGSEINEDKVQAISLAQVLTEHNISECDVLKLDCEGAEYAVLMESPPEIFNGIKRIIMEYHENNELQSHDLLVSFLETNGYQVSCYINFVHNDIGYLYAFRP